MNSNELKLGDQLRWKTPDEYNGKVGTVTKTVEYHPREKRSNTVLVTPNDPGYEERYLEGDGLEVLVERASD